MSFRELLTESSELDDIIKSIAKNTHYKKNAKIYGNDLYLEFGNGQGAMRLQKKLSNYFPEEVRSMSAGEIGFYDLIQNAILSIGGNTPKAYFKIEFRGSVPKEVSQLKAQTVTDDQVRDMAEKLR